MNGQIMIDTDKTSAKQLRALLFEVTNQDMTVRQLRAMLFLIDDQEKLESGYQVIARAEYADQKAS